MWRRQCAGLEWGRAGNMGAFTAEVTKMQAVINTEVKKKKKKQQHRV